MPTGDSKDSSEISYQVALELVETEKSYADQLQIVSNVYILRLQKLVVLGRPLLSSDEIANIFLNLEAIHQLSRNFLHDLLEYESNPIDLVDNLSGIIKQFLPFFKIYQQYVRGFSQAQTLLHQKRQTHKQFREFCELQETCENNDLDSYLITPIQRIPRYLLLLDSLMKQCKRNTVKKTKLKEALDLLKDLAASLNEQDPQSDLSSSLDRIQKQYFNDRITLCNCSSRKFLKQGALKKRWNNTSFKYKSHRKYLFFLFSDILLYASRPSGTNDYCQVKKILVLHQMELYDVNDTAEISNAWIIHSDAKKIEVYAPSKTEKNAWVHLLQSAIDQAKQNETRRTLRDIEQEILGEALSPSVESNAYSRLSISTPIRSTAGGPLSASYSYSAESWSVTPRSPLSFGGAKRFSYPSPRPQ